MKRRSTRRWWATGLSYGALLLLSLPFVLPLLWMLATAFKPTAQIYNDPLALWPSPMTLANFRVAWHLLDFPRFLANSLWVTGLSMVGAILSSALVGYAFATLPARGKGTLFTLLLMTMMLPPVATLIPQFVLFSARGWVNSYWPLILPSFFANAFYVFLFRQFFLGLPRELFESAEIDGCNPLLAFRWLALPLATPAIATVAIFAFISAWNDFLTPLIYLSTTSKFTLSLGLALFQGLFYTQLEYLMPMALVGLAPVLLLFCLAQRYFVQGIVTTGIQG